MFKKHNFLKQNYLGFSSEPSPIVFNFLMLGFNLICMIGMNATQTSGFLTKSRYFILQSGQITLNTLMFALNRENKILLEKIKIFFFCTVGYYTCRVWTLAKSRPKSSEERTTSFSVIQATVSSASRLKR